MTKTNMIFYSSVTSSMDKIKIDYPSSHKFFSKYITIKIVTNLNKHLKCRNVRTRNLQMLEFHFTIDTLSKKKLILYRSSNDLKDRDEVRSEVLESLFTHRQLVTFNSNGKLMLMERHRDSQTCDPKKVKGHLLCERTMTLAIPAINVILNTNPSMAFLANPALVAVSVIESGVSRGKCALFHLITSKMSTLSPSMINRSFPTLDTFTRLTRSISNEYNPNAYSPRPEESSSRALYSKQSRYEL